MEKETVRAEESETDGKKWFCLNLEMLNSKAAFLLVDASMGSILPFTILFYVSSGLSPADAGLVTGIGSIFSLIAGATWGPLADYTGRRKLILIILCIGSILAIFPLPWIVKVASKTESITICPHNTTNSTINSTSNINNLVQCSVSYKLLNPYTLFYVFLAMNAILNLFCGGLFAYIEGLVMNVVTHSKSKPTFGHQKMFGPIGFALGSFLSGIAIDHYKSEALSHYTGAFYVFLVCAILLIPVGYLLVGQNKINIKKTERNCKISKGAQLIMIFKKCDNVMFLFTILVSGMLLRSYQAFSFLLLQRELHLSKTMMSTTVIVCMLSELLVYPFSSKIIKLLGGNIPCIIIGMASYFPRFMVISYAKTAPVMIAIQLLHGIGVSLPWTCFMQHANQVVPGNIKMTVIMTMATFHFIVSGTVASMIGGIAYQHFGGRILFRGASLFALSWSIILILYFGIKHKTKSKPKRKIFSTLQNVETSFSNIA